MKRPLKPVVFSELLPSAIPLNKYVKLKGIQIIESMLWRFMH